MQIRPTAKAVIKESKSGKFIISADCSFRKSKSFFKPEPRMIGKDNRKLKCAACSLVNPKIRPPEIVEPEREKPGTSVKV